MKTSLINQLKKEFVDTLSITKKQYENRPVNEYPTGTYEINVDNVFIGTIFISRKVGTQMIFICGDNIYKTNQLYLPLKEIVDGNVGIITNNNIYRYFRAFADGMLIRVGNIVIPQGQGNIVMVDTIYYGSTRIFNDNMSFILDH